MNEHKPELNHFFVDNTKYETPETALKGLEIKTIASVPANYQLFLEEHGTAPDRAISDGESVDVRNPPKHFYAVPPATFGRR
ncbi:MAG: multiubiquitin domain-containing protein [Proteobacteria bacterium]|nr:multiubiquitin domain-containing protein [Pseudomonadota bacterium]